MTKVSDDARSKLNRLARRYFALFVLMSIFYFIEVLTWPSFSLVFIIAWLVFLPSRDKIIKEHKMDKGKQQAIENYWDNITSKELIKIDESWLGENLISARFINTEKNDFDCEILLNRQGCGSGVSREIKTHARFYAKDIISINGIDSPGFLPDPMATGNLLMQGLDFIYYEYRRKKNIVRSDYTLIAIEDIQTSINKEFCKVITKNYQNILKILLSEKEFKVAGKIIKGGLGKKLFLITAVKTEKEIFVLFPAKAIENIFSSLSLIILK